MAENKNEFSHWNSDVHNEHMLSQKLEPIKFIEITRLPPRMNSRALTSLIVSASKIVPKTTDICIKKAFNNDPKGEVVALIEFNSQSDAHKAILKLKAAAFTRLWHMRILTNPNLAKPEMDLTEN